MTMDVSWKINMMLKIEIWAQVWYSTPNLNNNWMTAVIGRSSHVARWTTLLKLGVEYQIWTETCEDVIEFIVFSIWVIRM